jgi:hypothetical protein
VHPVNIPEAHKIRWKIPNKEAVLTTNNSATPDRNTDLLASTKIISAHAKNNKRPEKERHRSGSKTFNRTILSIVVVCSIIQWHLKWKGALLLGSLNTEQIIRDPTKVDYSSRKTAKRPIRRKMLSLILDSLSNDGSIFWQKRHEFCNKWEGCFRGRNRKYF